MERSALNPTSNVPWHALPMERVLETLETEAARGLPTEEAEKRRRRYGPNVLTPRRQQSALVRFLLQFHQPLIYILLVATAVTAALGEWVDSAVIFGVVLANAVIGHIQEARALEAIAALARTMVSEATVVRSGQQQRMSAVELVPGDIVLLASGDKVPADLRLLEVRNLQVDESALTGESVPVSKSPAPVSEATGLGDRLCMGYATAMVTYGRSRGVVTAIGDHTEVGRISVMLSESDSLATPLTRKIHRFSQFLLIAILVLAAFAFSLGIYQGRATVDTFMATVALTVATIPEGLPAAITIMLALGVSRMARKRAIIRKLPAVETLGSTTIICSDKTGTLTENQMTVQRVVAGQRDFHVTGFGYAPEGAFLAGDVPVRVSDHPALAECLAIGILCNDSHLAFRDVRWVVDGDPTEGALLVSAAKAGLARSTLEPQLPRIDTIPFESEHQYMATLHQSPVEGAVLYIKGSMEEILARCSEMLGPDGTPMPLDRQHVKEQAEKLADDGLRVLAFARRSMDPERRELTRADVDAAGLVLVGLQGMLDPPRSEARQAIAECHRAGIQVKMVTGDHVLTATTIAQKLGIHGRVERGKLKALTGVQLASLGDEELADAAEATAVFARVSPEQKLRLVKALQSRRHVVAMTGDGVNDAPALKQANIGVAMGLSGTEVAKDAADMVLTDDNFASIEAAVEEGRGVFDNLAKFIVWTLPTNLGEGLTILASILLGTMLPILPVQILWVNMTSAVLLGLMLAFEPREPDVMRRAPRPVDEPILTRPLIFRTVLVGLLLLCASFGLFELLLQNGVDVATARTVAVNALVVGEIFYLFNCRSLVKPTSAIGWWTNPWVFVGTAGMLGLQLLFTYAPFMNTLFGTAPITLEMWGIILAAGLVLTTVVALEKRLVYRRIRRQDRHQTAKGAQDRPGS